MLFPYTDCIGTFKKLLSLNLKMFQLAVLLLVVCVSNVVYISYFIKCKSWLFPFSKYSALSVVYSPALLSYSTCIHQIFSIFYNFLYNTTIHHRVYSQTLYLNLSFYLKHSSISPQCRIQLGH